MPPKYSGNAGSNASKRPQNSSASRSSKREPSSESSAESPKGKPAGHSGGAHNNHAPRSDGRSANGPNGRSGSRPSSRSDSRPDLRDGLTRDSRSHSGQNSRDARDGFSQGRPAQRSGTAKPVHATQPPATEPENQDAMRLNKAIAATGLCSRRKADELILAGRVRVDGQPESNPGRQVLPSESIAVDGRVLSAPQSYTYLMLNKPVQVVCTVSDPEGRPTVLDCLPPAYKGLRLYPVGRLDYFSEGMLLLTNDGQLAQRLTHPRHHQPKTYEVLVRGSVPENALKTMRRGMRLAEGEDLLPVEVTAQPAAGNTSLQMVLRQGFNRQIRRMCRDLGLTVLRLCRVAQGSLRLGNLASGKVRPLTDAEVAKLRESADLPANR